MRITNQGAYPSEYTLYNKLTANVNIFLNLLFFSTVSPQVFHLCVKSFRLLLILRLK